MTTKEDILLILSNLAFSKVHKIRFDEDKDLLLYLLQVMSDESQSLKARSICSQFFVNVVYKCTRSISVLNKQAVLDELKLMIDEGERGVDRLTFDETILTSPDEKDSQVHLLKTFVANLRALSSMIGVNCPAN